MNLKEIEYILKIDEERNVTRAAEKLYLTPSALNQQLLKLEQEIGTPLFHRVRTGLTRTEAGEIYIEGARELMRVKKETYRRLQDVTDRKKGTLSIGFPPERGSLMFTSVYPHFHAEYPDIVINVMESSVRSQQHAIAKGELDLGFVTLRENQCTKDDYHLICSEELILAVPSSHPACAQAVSSDKGNYPELSIDALQDFPFALMYKESTIYECVDQIFRQAKIVPNVLFETARSDTILDIVSAGMCCGIIPDSDVLSPKENVSFFCLPDHPHWNIMALTRKGSYLSKPAKTFIELATRYWNSSLKNYENPPAGGVISWI